jgi:hypothetical protein
MSHKTRNFIILIFIIVTLTACIVYFKAKINTSTRELGMQDPTTLKNTFGRMAIEPPDLLADELDSKYKVTKDMAIKIANNISGLGKKCKSIHAQFAIMTNEDILEAVIPQGTIDNNPKIKAKGYLYRVPVWIISYEGLSINRRGNNRLTETNKVIDATTGELIYDYNYR